ncbi:MAG: tyrosine--tRNA ligase [Chlamydiales bacterium]|nr:tyrosine--tRNA ligase [Chlamydiia bacterium]MCP5508189.1 tyrosine--tRNA ligase [Chlamydiales bacterium]
MSKNVIEVLKERGFIEALTSEEIATLAKQPIRVYCGFDPTGDSLHLGNLVAVMGLAWFQRFGHTPVAIVGGATGMIGDPSGKSHERNLLDEATIKKNLEGISLNLKQVLDFHADNGTIVLNNFDWMKGFSYIQFLRDVGKHFRIGPMLAKDSVKTRLASEEGMSYTEFSYQLLQAYDFHYLLQNHDVQIQLGGSDQWGNITAGIDLIRRLQGKSAYGVTFPLLTRSDGQKFGKSEKGAIWLSAEKLSPYEFYQYLIRTADADVIKLLKMLTFMEIDEIHAIEAQMQQSDYEANSAQKRLAEEVTKIVHGEEGLRDAQRVTAAAAPGGSTQLNAETLESLAKEIPNISLSREEVVEAKLIDLIVQMKMLDSKGAVRRLIRNGGVYLNNEKVNDENHTVSDDDLVDGKLLLIAVGKKNKAVVQLKD